MTHETETATQDLTQDDLDTVVAGETTATPSARAPAGFAYATLTVSGAPVYTVTFSGNFAG
jgi:hypothetical protein